MPRTPWPRRRAATIDRLETLGATIVDPVDLAVADVGDPEFAAMLCEFKPAIGTYLRSLGSDGPQTLQDLIDFNLEHADVEMAFFKQETFDEAQAAPEADDPACIEARTTATQLAQAAIDDALTANDLDAIIAPTGEPAWRTDMVAGDVFVGPYSGTPSAVAGYPAITIPAGYVSGLPVGISFIGGNYSEPTLLALAYALEQDLDVRVPPTYPDSVELETPSSGDPPPEEETAEASPPA